MLRVTDVQHLINAATNQDRKDGRHSKNINGLMIQTLVESMRSCVVSFKIHNADKKSLALSPWLVVTN